MNRTEELLKLRPKIKSIQQDLNTSDLEQFQNDKLRPILKLQHEILLALFQSNLSRNKVLFAELKVEEKRSVGRKEKENGNKCDKGKETKRKKEK